MKKSTLFFVLLILLLSCSNKQANITSFKTGKFKTVLDDGETTSYAVRNDSLQIETYNNKVDTFYIKWESNFKYILLKKNPKVLLDSTPFHVKITAIKGNTYKFNAYYKGSKFKQKGEAIKLD